MLKELIVFILDKRIMNMADFMLMSSGAFAPEYFSVIVGYNAMLERICKGNYLKYAKGKKAE
jgi:hypothetical protein